VEVDFQWFDYVPSMDAFVSGKVDAVCNPGRVHEVVEVPVPRPRSEEQLFDPTFMATRRHIDGIMHPPGTQQKETPVTSTNASTSTRSSP
jgi:hypothetical protein